MDRIQYLEELHGETREDILQGEEQAKLAEELRNIGWEILDLLPPERANDLQKELIDEIIQNGWAK